MILNVYSVFDAKLAAYNVPFFARTDADANRSFGDLCIDARSRVAQHREDYSLYRLGQFDDETGLLVPSTPVCLMTASAIVVQESGRAPLPPDYGTSGAAADKADAASGRKAEEE